MNEPVDAQPFDAAMTFDAAVTFDAVLTFDAVILAGGRGFRLGGVSKPDVQVGGRTLLDHALDAVSGARRVVVVGPPSLARRGVTTVLEDPPSGGPVAGIGAGFTALVRAAPDDDAPVLVLACDVPLAGAVVPDLAAALRLAPDADGTLLVAPDGGRQIVALLRRQALGVALAALADDGGLHGVSFRRLCAQLDLVLVTDEAGLGADADTWDDVRRLDALLRGGETVDEHPDPAPDAGRPDGPAPVGSDLHRWVVSTAESLGVDPDVLDVDLILDLARDVAHTVTRPAVPLTTFLVGYAVALAGGDRAALERVVEHAARLAVEWESAAGQDAAGKDGH